MTQDILIAVRNLSRRFGGLLVVDQLDFDLHRGEVLGFLGPNGAGKSTTMKMLAGVLAPESGQILINGIDLQEEPEAAKDLIGYLPEQPPLYPDLKVDEYLHYCARLHGIPRSTTSTGVDAAKERCGLVDSGNRLIRNLSKGYQQRVGIAQAILHQPEIVILDEPTVGLDPIQIREIRDLIREIGTDHSVILSTHILPEVQAVCDRVLIINQGRLVLNEKLANIAQNNDRIRIGLHRPPPVEILNTLDGVTAVAQHRAQEYSLHIQDDSLTPEHLATIAADKDWGLFLLKQETTSLEETFVRLTCGDSSPELGDFIPETSADSSEPEITTT